MDVRSVFASLVEDPEAGRKLGLAAVVSLVPVLSVAVGGYAARFARRVAEREERPLPAWDDLGGLWKEGLGLSLGSLTYAAAAGVIIGLPLLGAGYGAAWAKDAPASSLPVASIMLLIEAAIVLAAVVGLGLSLLWPGVLALYAAAPHVRTCFQFDSVARLLARHPADYLTCWGVSLLLAGAWASIFAPLAALLAMIPCLGLLAALLTGAAGAIVLLMVTSHLAGQLADAAALLPARPAPAPGAPQP
jgi:hypothetical protein